MKNQSENNNRRNFLKNSALLTFGLASIPFVGIANELPNQTEDSLYIIGPMDGYDPQVGTLLSTEHDASLVNKQCKRFNN